MANRPNVSGSETASEPQVLTVREASALLDVNVKTLYAEITAGRFPAIRLGRAIRIPRVAVMSLLDHGQIALPGRGQG